MNLIFAASIFLSSSEDGLDPLISSPTTLKWLLDNFEQVDWHCTDYTNLILTVEGCSTVRNLFSGLSYISRVRRQARRVRQVRQFVEFDISSLKSSNPHSFELKYHFRFSSNRIWYRISYHTFQTTFQTMTAINKRHKSPTKMTKKKVDKRIGACCVTVTYK